MRIICGHMGTVDMNGVSMMPSYPNMLTPPSSNEDSPAYIAASPSSNSFHGFEGYAPSSDVRVVSPFQRTTPFDESKGEVIVVHSDLGVGQNDLHNNMSNNTFLHFIEQPVDKFRFRYKSEMAGTHGSLTGMRADRSRKQTYPTVQLKNCSFDTVVVRCSIYQIYQMNSEDEMPHAHRLIMKKGRDEVDDPHDLLIGPHDDYIATFHGMGIIHTAKKNIVSELVRKKSQLRKEKLARDEGKVRDLTTKEIMEIKGLAESESKSINLNIVCLRFDAFIRQNGILYPICSPLFSHGINNLKSAQTGDLKIVRLDHCVSPAKGNKEIFILVERVTKKNIKIRFYELDDDGRVLWEDWGRFNDMDVHHQYAIVFKTPKYRDENITEPIQVYMELVRPSDHAHSEPREFRYIPNKHPYKPGQKRPRYDYTSTEYGSSDFGSNELPAVIDNLNIEQNMDLATIPSALSDELKKAVNNIDSDEFVKLFTEYAPTYSALWDEMVKDTPRATSNYKYNKSCYNTFTPPSVHIKIEVSSEDKRNAMRTLEELKSFMLSKNNQRAPEILKHYLGERNRNNALHVFVSQNNRDATVFLLKLLIHFKCSELVNTPNEESKTALHLAVLSRNIELIKCLLKCKARVGALDAGLNTTLHFAVKQSDVSINILQLLLIDRETETVKEYINLKNSDGDSALFVAIERNNIEALKMLCKAGADVNIINDKTGFVPLRFAIEKQNTQITRYLLNLPDISPLIEDFRNMGPLDAGLKKNSKELVDIIQQYIVENNVQMIFKEEPEEEESDEDVEYDVKPVTLPPDRLKLLYGSMKCMTPSCLNEVSTILDKSRSWGCLSELLNIDHLIASGIIQSEHSMTKAILTYAMETNNDTLWTIREFLESLDELKAVQILDRMVQDFRNNE